MNLLDVNGICKITFHLEGLTAKVDVDFVVIGPDGAPIAIKGKDGSIYNWNFIAAIEKMEKGEK